jgi:serine/threonine protein kinase
MIPVLGGCAGAIAAGPEGGVAGAAIGHAVEKAISFFGGRIVQRWCQWFQGQPAEGRQAAVAELAAMSPAEARKEAGAAFERLAPQARPEDVDFALAYLSAIPNSIDRALVPDPATGIRSLPATLSFDDPNQLLQVLPTDVPPYAVPSELPNTHYLLEEMVGSGGFGAVYRATTRSLQHLPLAIKFCLDPNLQPALHRERSNLERLMKASVEDWSARIVRLYGYDLEHNTPYLVYEFVSGGDLTHHLAVRRQRKGADLNSDEVLDLILQVTQGLTFAHRHGLVHRDLKPANVLVDGETLKLADFGLGGVSAARAAQVSRIGSTTMDYLTVSERASLFRGAGTPLYMSPEQRRGAPADPRQDLYSLGVMWFQLLAGDVTRELHAGWAKELSVKYQVPAAHLEVIGRCVGWVEERPRDAGELLPMLQALKSPPPPPVAVPALTAAASGTPSGELRLSVLHALVRQLQEGQKEAARLASFGKPIALASLLGISMFLIAVFSSGGEPLAIVLLFVAAAIAGVVFMGNRKLRREADSRVEVTLHTLERDFPDMVQQWGGATMLRSPTMLSGVLGHLSASRSSALSHAGPSSALRVPDERKQDLVDKLRELEKAQRREAWFGQRRALPWWLALLLSALLFGAPGGVAAGLLFQHERQPGSLYSEHFDTRGNYLSTAQSQLEERHVSVTAALIGITVGLPLTLVGTVLLSVWRWHRLPLFGGLGLGALLGAGAGMGSGILYFEYFHPSHEFGSTFFDYHGSNISHVDFQLEERRAEVRAWCTGIGTGIGLGLLVTTVTVWRWGRAQARARHAVEQTFGELAASFPQVVTIAGWNEVGTQPDARTVQEALRRLEASA